MAKAIFDPSSDRFTCGIIARKARQLVGRAGFKEHDVADIQQDLFFRVWQAMPRFDPTVAHRNVFVTTVVERYVATVLRNKRAAKRDYRRISSLNVQIDVRDEGATELIQAIDNGAHDARFGRRRQNPQEIAELKVDLASVIESLPANCQLLLELRKSHSLSEAAVAMGVARTTASDWMRRIRLRFEQAGIEKYLDY